MTNLLVIAPLFDTSNSSTFLNPLLRINVLSKFFWISDDLTNVMIHKLAYPKFTPGKNEEGNNANSLILVFVNKNLRIDKCLCNDRKVSGIIKLNSPPSFKH